MGVRLGTTHMKTLFKLYEMAEKHNCYILMGVDDIYDNEDCDMDYIAKRGDMSDKVRKEIENNLYIEEARTIGYSYWFELVDKRDKEHIKYNNLEYKDYSTWFRYDENDVDSLSKEAQEWLEENDEYQDGSIYQNCAHQEMNGWEGVDTSEINVYREGMLLKFFGDLVCDYLGEERIYEVY